MPQEDSTVYLKGDANPIQGYVTRKDNYVIIEKEGSEQVIPWSEIKSITGPKPIAQKSSLFNFWLDKVDFLSGLGVIAALIVFSVGLYQYQQGLVWKREEFLTGLIKSFGESPNVYNAKKMMESLIQYKTASIELYPESDAGKKIVDIKNEEIFESLAVPLTEVGEHAPSIRNSFDVFLDYLERFEHHIQSRVVNKSSLKVYIGYWIDVLGRHDKISETYRIKVIQYARFFEYDGVIHLINRYNRWHRFWCWIKSLFMKTKIRETERSQPDDTNSSNSANPKTTNTNIMSGGFAPKILSSVTIGLFAVRTLFKVWKK
ncbi:MAG TPA: hypothetical protein VFA21_22360 [Pyrinomonadaceae bacterium]|nr:hypothetical protein [Pyrinomonadaceae bacterium]